MLTLHHVSIDSIDLGCFFSTGQVRSALSVRLTCHTHASHMSPIFQILYSSDCNHGFVERFHTVGQSGHGGGYLVEQLQSDRPRKGSAHMLKVAEFGVACIVAYLIQLMLA